MVWTALSRSCGWDGVSEESDTVLPHLGNVDCLQHSEGANDLALPHQRSGALVLALIKVLVVHHSAGWAWFVGPFEGSQSKVGPVIGHYPATTLFPRPLAIFSGGREEHSRSLVHRAVLAMSLSCCIFGIYMIK